MLRKSQNPVRRCGTAIIRRKAIKVEWFPARDAIDTCQFVSRNHQRMAKIHLELNVECIKPVFYAIPMVLRCFLGPCPKISSLEMPMYADGLVLLNSRTREGKLDPQKKQDCIKHIPSRKPVAEHPTHDDS